MDITELTNNAYEAFRTHWERMDIKIFLSDQERAAAQSYFVAGYTIAINSVSKNYFKINKWNRSIDDFAFSTRVRNALNNTGVRSMGELARMQESCLLKLRCLGKKSLKEIKDKLQEEGLHLGMNIDFNNYFIVNEKE